eukprot:3023431-Rhodomonas_salina.1
MVLPGGGRDVSRGWTGTRTEIAYGATLCAVLRSPRVLRACCALSGTEIRYAKLLAPMHSLHGYDASLCFYASAMRCPVLTSGCCDQGGVLVPEPGSVLCLCYTMSGTGIAHSAMLVLRDVRY